jgi:membrane protease YdiL (CAAX protease family)
MTATFEALGRHYSPRTAYNLGFALYWSVWCLGFPTCVLGPKGIRRLLVTGDRPSTGDLALLAFPVLGAAVTQLLPNRHRITPELALVMVSSATVNALGEELLWRGVFLEEFENDVIFGAVWPLVGFAIWHLAPQRILPAAIGRWKFVAGSAVVGMVSTITAWRSRGLRNVLIAHAATDACGVTAARFRLGR